jgi:hypothetical protein
MYDDVTQVLHVFNGHSDRVTTVSFVWRARRYKFFFCFFHGGVVAQKVTTLNTTLN